MAAWGRLAVCSSAVASVYLGQLAFGREQRSKMQELSVSPSSAANIGSKQAEHCTWDNNWDRRQPEPGTAEGISKSERHIILIRHGQYNLKGKGDAERYLSDLGRQQADLTGQCLKKLEFAGVKYTALHQSTMTRSIETASIIRSHLPHVPIKTDPLLCEGAPIQPDPPSAAWKPEAKEFFKDGARIEAAFRKYFHRASPEQEEDSYEIIVGHANVIRYFVCRALQLPPEAWLRMSHGHCGLTHVIMRSNGRVVLESYGDTGHLPPHLITYS